MVDNKFPLSRGDALDSAIQSAQSIADLNSLRSKMESAEGRFMAAVFAALAELERESIRERQREGIAAARARRRKLGRPCTEYPERWDEVFSKWKLGRVTAAAAMRELGLRRTTYYKLVKQWELKCERLAS